MTYDQLPTLHRERGSLEYVDADITITLTNGTPLDAPTSYQVSAVLNGAQVAGQDWHDAPWLTTFTTPGDYLVRIRYTDTPEQPIAPAYWLHIP